MNSPGTGSSPRLQTARDRRHVQQQQQQQQQHTTQDIPVLPAPSSPGGLSVLLAHPPQLQEGGAGLPSHQGGAAGTSSPPQLLQPPGIGFMQPQPHTLLASPRSPPQQQQLFLQQQQQQQQLFPQQPPELFQDDAGPELKPGHTLDDAAAAMLFDQPAALADDGGHAAAAAATAAAAAAAGPAAGPGLKRHASTDDAWPGPARRAKKYRPSWAERQQQQTEDITLVLEDAHSLLWVILCGSVLQPQMQPAAAPAAVPGFPMSLFPDVFAWAFGYGLDVQLFGFQTLKPFMIWLVGDLGRVEREDSGVTFIRAAAHVKYSRSAPPPPSLRTLPPRDSAAQDEEAPGAPGRRRLRGARGRRGARNQQQQAPDEEMVPPAVNDGALMEVVLEGAPTVGGAEEAPAATAKPRACAGQRKSAAVAGKELEWVVEVVSSALQEAAAGSASPQVPAAAAGGDRAHDTPVYEQAARPPLCGEGAAAVSAGVKQHATPRHGRRRLLPAAAAGCDSAASGGWEPEAAAFPARAAPNAAAAAAGGGMHAAGSMGGALGAGAAASVDGRWRAKVMRAVERLLRMKVADIPPAFDAWGNRLLTVPIQAGYPIWLLPTDLEEASGITLDLPALGFATLAQLVRSLPHVACAVPSRRDTSHRVFPPKPLADCRDGGSSALTHTTCVRRLVGSPGSAGGSRPACGNGGGGSTQVVEETKTEGGPRAGREAALMQPPPPLMLPHPEPQPQHALQASQDIGAAPTAAAPALPPLADMQAVLHIIAAVATGATHVLSALPPAAITDEVLGALLHAAAATRKSSHLLADSAALASAITALRVIMAGQAAAAAAGSGANCTLVARRSSEPRVQEI